MMARSVSVAAAALVGLGCALPAQAQGVSGCGHSMVEGTKAFCRSVARDTKRRNCWPEPFVRPDRYAARAPFAMMVAKGWQRQNMLVEHHFSTETGELTKAGWLKLRWILTEAPPPHRIVYVHVADNVEQTAKRIDHVQQLAARLVPKGELPRVLETDIADYGWPAERVDEIHRAWQNSSNIPRIPYRKATINVGEGE